MVLAELGSKIASAVRNMSSKATIGDVELKTFLNDMARALLEADVSIVTVKKLQDSIKAELALTRNASGYDTRKCLELAAMNAIRKVLDPGTKPFVPKKGTTNIVMFVGMQGAGKTTSCTKYGMFYLKKGFKVGVICADTFRAGAYDQLKQNASKAKLEFYGSLVESDPSAIARDGIRALSQSGHDLIIVDTSGRHRQEAALFEEMARIQTTVKPHDVVFVMSATDGQGVSDQATSFKARVPVGSVILTKLDCHTKGGGALTAVAATKSPIVFIGTGEHFDQFERFDAQQFTNRLMGRGDVKGLVDTLKDSNLENSESVKRLQEGIFTLRDMYEYLQNMSKAGSVGRIFDMIPGMGALDVADKGSSAIRGFIVIMDSMTQAELDDPKVKKTFSQPSRIMRVARGSARSPNEVQQLIVAYLKVEEVVKRIGKSTLKSMSQDPSGAMNRLGPQQMQNIVKAFNPKMLQQLGGAAGLQGMLKQMGQMGRGL